MLFGDYHTHTVYSHGKGSIEDNVYAAYKKGLKQIAITDHSFSHMAFAVSREEFNLMRVEVETLRRKYKGKIDILLGLESNLMSVDGKIDVLPEERRICDILIVGYHKSFFAPSFKSFFNFFFTNGFGWSRFSKKQIERNTQAYVNAINNNEIDVISHLKGNRCLVDVKRVAQACIENNTYIELNGKRINFTDQELKDMIEMGVKFIINSDAHHPDRVGQCHQGINIIEKYNIPHEQIVNYDSIPKFKYYNNEE